MEDMRANGLMDYKMDQVNIFLMMEELLPDIGKKEFIVNKLIEIR